MRVLIVIALLVGAAFMIVFVLMGLARELSRLSYHSPPDLDSSGGWDVSEIDMRDNEFVQQGATLFRSWREPPNEEAARIGRP
jgi:hypothetical protein